MKKVFSRLYDFSSSWTGTIVIVLLFIFFVAQAFVIPSGSMKNTLLIGDHLFVKKFAYGIPTPHIPWLEIPVWFDSDGDGHLINGDKPKRGDIVVFRYPSDPKIYYVKRNFALGGDEIVFAPKTMYLRPYEGDDFIDKNYPKEDIVSFGGKKFVKEPYKFKGIHYEDKGEKDNFVGQSADTFTIALYYLNQNKFAMQPAQVEELPSINGLPFNAFYFKVPQNEYFMVGDNRENSNDSRFWGSVSYKYIVGTPWFVYFSWDKDYKVRWERIGRLVNTIENDETLIYEQP
ncbi:signal peptidase I [Campylobacter hyointestinalis]|uniref:Signal peptidase I n=2 Tax=Campylobacter hyointestinalis TaxID=198 RepID=A0AAV6EG78_CAMHY|nr:signal peptidase I [Campylobacter hyointestinalis]KAB0614091.1 signal peptidase I [Campylobacter hyointestinalis subsp. lawsonii]QKF69827.1 leader peptidase (signal peptidase I) [Campylobacter hyointestinalis subsp. lawsonii]RAZ29799.1 signal peptidase I [Campylobacter hyointestinalis subsp. lawsonii]RAZ60992.1 signal peptidase I [Campylobacter hyointestinalis subsp. lawsonii]TWO19640.1 signal peptidase I [Campylobacter hyointestinalis]